MASLTISGLDDQLVERLKERARDNDRTPEEEVRSLIEEAVTPKSKAQLLAEADAIAALTRGKVKVDSTDLIREDRDR
jgi:plasmid stability protein